MNEKLETSIPETVNNTSDSRPLHLQMSGDELTLFVYKHDGVWTRIAKTYGVTSVYVGDIARGRRAVDSRKARAISRAIDREIMKSRASAA